MGDTLLNTGAAEAVSAGTETANQAGSATANAAGTGGASATAAQAGYVNPDGTFAEGWLDRLPEELAEAKPTLEKFRSFGDLAKSYASLQTTLGKKASAVAIPNEKSTPEEIAAYRKAVGAPDAPDGYKLKPEQLPEGMTWDDELGKGFAEIAHKHNIPAAAMQELAARYVASEAAKVEEYSKKAYADVEEGKAALRKEFGGNFDANIQLAARVANTVGLDPNLVTHPEIVKALVRMGKMVSEDKISQLGQSAQAGALNAKDIMTNPANPYHKRYQEGDPETVGMVRDLMRRAS